MLVSFVDSHIFPLFSLQIRHGLHTTVAAIVVEEPPSKGPYLRVATFAPITGSGNASSFIALSSPKETMVLRAEDGALVNVKKPGTPFTLSDEDVGFYQQGGETLAMGTMCDGSRVVQVWETILIWRAPFDMRQVAVSTTTDLI